MLGALRSAGDRGHQGGDGNSSRGTVCTGERGPTRGQEALFSRKLLQIPESQDQRASSPWLYSGRDQRTLVSHG